MRDFWGITLSLLALCFLSVSVLSSSATTLQHKEDTSVNSGKMHLDSRIQPYKSDPRYWQYRGKPVLLLGGSETDHIFLLDDLKTHLDEIASVGGNYVRNTMSQREGKELKPHRLLPDGKFDLNQWNDGYWNRFQNMLKWTSEREIIVQIEVWDRFDYSTSNWMHSPWNPANNLNYTYEESSFAPEYPKHPGQDLQPFFHTMSSMDDNTLIRDYQETFVSKMLSYSLQYDNILYCMDNETNTDPEWGAYWSNYIKAKAVEAGIKVETTEMWDARTLDSPVYDNTFDHPENYSFIEVSQNNHNSDRVHWDNVRLVCERIQKTGKLRPINTVKIYGASTGTYGRNRDGQERFWRNILGGLAGTRFHRPSSGLGLNDKAKAHIRSLRMFTDALDFFNCEPHMELLGWHWRNRNEAYCVAKPGKEYGLFFTDGGMVTLDVRAVGERELTVRWINIMASKWLAPVSVKPENGNIQLLTPDDGYWAVLVK